jgi:glyoxylase I family protein
MLLGLHHVALICRDYPRARHFYVDVLGLPVIAEHYRAERDSWKLDLALPDGSQLELFSFPEAPPRPSYPEARGLRHLAFSVADLEQAITQLARHDILCETVRHDARTGARFTFFQDPDGLPLELYEQPDLLRQQAEHLTRI